MVVTLTSKGQLTVPKAIRDRMRLDTGSKLDFRVQDDGTLTVRLLNRSIDSLIGMLHRPGRRAVTVKEMNKAIGDHLAADDRRILRQARERTKRVAKKAAR